MMRWGVEFGRLNELLERTSDETRPSPDCVRGVPGHWTGNSVWILPRHRGFERRYPGFGGVIQSVCRDHGTRGAGRVCADGAGGFAAALGGVFGGCGTDPAAWGGAEKGGGD